MIGRKSLLHRTRPGFVEGLQKSPTPACAFGRNGCIGQWTFVSLVAPTCSVAIPSFKRKRNLLQGKCGHEPAFVGRRPFICRLRWRTWHTRRTLEKPLDDHHPSEGHDNLREIASEDCDAAAPLSPVSFVGPPTPAKDGSRRGVGGTRYLQEVTRWPWDVGRSKPLLCASSPLSASNQN
jgi:hypothetical protein